MSEEKIKSVTPDFLGALTERVIAIVDKLGELDNVSKSTEMLKQEV